MGRSWWNCEGGVWGRVGGILKVVFWVRVGGNVKVVCGQIWWNCEGGVWGRVGGIVKVMCGPELVEL